MLTYFLNLFLFKGLLEREERQGEPAFGKCPPSTQQGLRRAAGLAHHGATPYKAAPFRKVEALPS